MPAREDMLSTLRKSVKSAREKWAAVHDAAVEQYGEGERAHRTAFAKLKESHEKRGDRWVEKTRRGPSDPRGTKTTAEKRAGKGETYGGVSLFQNTKHDLYERARRIDVPGRSRMSKEELARELGKRGG